MSKTPALNLQADTRARSRRAPVRRRQLSLELQAPVKLATALALGGIAVAAGLPAGGTAALLVVGAAAIWRSLLVMGADVEGRTQLRPQGEASWDAALAGGAAMAAVLLAVEGSLAGALLATAGTACFAGLRLTTRYVVG